MGYAVSHRKLGLQDKFTKQVIVKDRDEMSILSQKRAIQRKISKHLEDMLTISYRSNAESKGNRSESGGTGHM